MIAGAKELMFMLPLFVLLRRIAEPISSLSPFFSPMWKRKRWIFRASASTEKGPLPPLPLPASASASTSLVVTQKDLEISEVLGLRTVAIVGKLNKLVHFGYFSLKAWFFSMMYLNFRKDTSKIEV